MINLRSCPCTHEQLVSEAFRNWCELIKENKAQIHRKIWEWCFIAQVLSEQNLLQPGKRGLGFAVGQEPLVALFAKYGCKILATDIDTSKASDWEKTGQHSGNLNDLNKRNICDEYTFYKNVDFMTVDMTDIPKNLNDFDFCWSSCAFEHLGSIKKGIDFIYNMISCLKPGGIAVHTTEINVISDDKTIDNGGAVLYRRRDFEEIAKRLKAEGHHVELDFTLGSTEYDVFVDRPPYKHHPHLKLQIGNYISTSYGLVVKVKA